MHDHPEKQNSILVPLVIFAVLVALIVFGVLSVIVVRMSSRTYQAQSVIRLQRAGYSPREFMIFKETQANIIRSPVVLQKAAENPAIAALLKNRPDPVGYIQRQVQVELAAESELLVVRFNCDDAETARDVLDGVVAAYIALESGPDDDGDEDASPRVQVIQRATIPELDSR
jgi:hypothetical protein